MTDNDSNDGDLFGTEAAWPTMAEANAILGVETATFAVVPTNTIAFELAYLNPDNYSTTPPVIRHVDDYNDPVSLALANGELTIPDEETHSGVTASVPIPGAEMFPVATNKETQIQVAAIIQTRDMEATNFPTAEAGVDEHVIVAEDDDAKERRIKEEVQEWTEAKVASTAAVEAEREARKTLSATLFPNPKKGTQRFALPAGYSIKLVHGWNYNLGDKDKMSEQGVAVPIYDQVVELEAAIAKLGAEGPLLAPRLIKWTPSLVESEYLRLCRNDATEVEVEAKTLIDAMLTVTEKTPALELEEPKAPK